MSGGLPVIVIAALDVFPIAPDKAFLKKQPGVDNRRVFDTKLRVRNAFNRDLPPHRRCNIIHSSDNASQAANYITLALPEHAASIFAKAEKLIAANKPDDDVITTLTRSGKRAVVELVNWHGTTAVRKRFRPGMEHYFEREWRALQHLNAVGEKAVPQLLERGSNFVVMSHHKDARRMIGQIMDLPLSTESARNAVLAARRVFDEGIVLHDFRPHNLIVGPDNSVTLVDFECATLRSEEDANLKFEDLEAFQKSNYDRTWRRAAGLKYESLINDPLWLLRLKRWTAGNARIVIEAIKKVNQSAWRSIERRRQRTQTKRAVRAARESQAR